LKSCDFEPVLAKTCQVPSFGPLVAKSPIVFDPQMKKGAPSGLKPEGHAPFTSKPARWSRPFETLVNSARPSSIYKFVLHPISRSPHVSCCMASVQKAAYFFLCAVSFGHWLDKGYDTFRRICSTKHETFLIYPGGKVSYCRTMFSVMCRKLRET